MTVTLREATSNAGPGGNSSSLYSSGENVSVTSATLAGTFSAPVGTSEVILYQVPPASRLSPSGATNYTFPAVIQNINQLLMTAGATLAANTANLTLSFNLRRAGAVVGGGAFAGWAANSNPLLTAFVPVSVPWLVANTALVVPYPQAAAALTATNALLPLQANDVITASLVVITGAVTVPFFNLFLDGS